MIYFECFQAIYKQQKQNKKWIMGPEIYILNTIDDILIQLLQPFRDGAFKSYLFFSFYR
jgi:hypothetical protein